MASSSAIPPLLLLSLFPFLPLNAASNVTLGSSLSATSDNNPSWVSPSGDFAFGFRQLNNTDIFLLAIWYAQLPDRTILWQASTTSPVQAGSNIELTASGLSLTDPNGLTIWSVQPNSTVSYGTMLDTGNFILSGTNTDVYAWQSFDYPTDTILPTQILPLGGMLYSKLSATNYTKGRFELHFTNGDLQLNPIAWPTEHPYTNYYNSGTASPNSSRSGFQLVFNQSGEVYILLEDGSNFQFINWQSILPNSNNYYRATLDFDGVFREYACAKSSDGNQSWSVVGYIPKNICADLINKDYGSGACGYNSYCVANGASIRCNCLPGFSYIDPNNENGGCAPDFPPNCEVDNGIGNPEDVYELKELQNINFPFGDYDMLGPYNSTVQCGQACLQDCNCAVSIFNGEYCWKKRLPMSNGRQEAALAFVKVMKGVISLMVFSRRQRKSRKDINDSSVFETNLHVFTFEELKKATEEFKEELGRGSFGIVYKGVVKYGSKIQVAVKKLDKLSQGGEKEFKAEVTAIGRTHHKNLVQLLGYCYEGPHRILVYEFMSNGSLANFLFGIPRPDWYQRVQVALGIARGLVYLHEECTTPIIHCDIKPQNILIDKLFIPRISDFGLAKSLELNQTRTHTGIRGTRGYIAPEWFRNVPVTVKVDVYSFGVMLLEIICCRKSVTQEFEHEERAILTDWAYDCFREGTLDALVENDDAAMNDIETLRGWVMTAICCVQEDPLQRPAMSTVLRMLEGHVEVPSPI
ncbi:G-type lectin S-receptor-like serine/threonine-protein kinase LECRK3 [Rhododendron vialii]|uniref:G-type lectin S-receptor-like serine/threonine-protein kinase LECRK3 n=1 Tax=Rhododendron vialii TaxID=182163 RepID=UPI002660571F|nr:G-type lectin S-receptor-like serine/threonine-protein kinase LECRK3 [Rhododendron vialii]